MDRSFRREPDSSEAGENLSFDFSDEDGPVTGDDTARPQAEAHSEDRWEVGEPSDFATTRESEARARRQKPKFAPPHPDLSVPPRAPEPQREFVDREFTIHEEPAPDEAPHSAGWRQRIADEAAQVAQYATLGSHSSSWFLGLFAAVAAVFAVLTVMVYSEPSASARLLSATPIIGERFARPIVPAMLVALHDIHADYVTIKDGRSALLVSGTAENVGSAPLHAVLIGVDLLDRSGHHLASGASYCGNGLTARMVTEMTPREIDFLQRLDPQKTFAIEGAQSAPFLMVFMSPPPGITDLRIAVAKAVAQETIQPPHNS